MYPYDQHKVQIYDINTLFEEEVPIEVLKQSHEKYCNLTGKDLDKWRSIGRTIYQITNHTERSTHVQMKNIIEFYVLLNENHRLFEDGKNRWREIYLADEKVYDFFMNTFFYDCAKYLIDEKMFHYEETTELSNRILLQSIYIFITTFEKTTVPTIEMLAYIFDHKKQYFQINNKLNNNFHIQQLYGLREDIREWLQTLQVGQVVDAIKIDKQHAKNSWSRAEISNIQDDHVFLRFLNASKQFNRSVWREGFDIREKGTRCPDEEVQWREDLKEGDLVDCCDTSHVFYNSTVLQVKDIEDEQGYQIKQVYVAYRVYDPNGTKKDEKGNKFNGWSQQYDEWLDAFHPRIQKYQSQAKKLYTKASTSNQDEHIDDFNDLVQTLEVDEVVYASPKRNQCQSLFLMAAINKFGRKGGFDLILNKIEGQGEEWCPIDHLSSFMHALGNVQNCLNRNFVYPYAKRIIPAVQRNILDSPASNLRNFTKEKIDSVNIGLGSFMKRIYSIGQKIEMLEKFNLQTALQSFNSEFITTQLQGLKTIMELLSQLRSDRTAESLQSSELKDWIEQNQIFQKLFNSSKYQLIQKAGDFFKFMLNEGMIKEQHLEILWNQTRKNDTELKLAIYKILSDNYYTQSFDKTIIEFFLNKIIETDPADIGNEDIDLVHSFTKYRNKGSEFQDSVRMFYWKLIENSHELPLDLVEETIKSFCESYNIDNNKVTIQAVLEKCIEHIDTVSHSTLYVLKIIQKIVDQLFSTQGYIDTIIKKDAVNFLFTDKNIVHVLVNNIRQMKKDLQQKVSDSLGAQALKQLTEQILDSFIPRNTYIEHIQSRIDFLNFIYMNLPTEIELTLEVISEVWDAVIVEGLIPREKDIIYKWFSELNTNNMNQSSQQIKKEDLDIFFHTKLCNEEDLRSMTPEGLNCFKSIFCILNEKDGKMKKYPAVKMYNNNLYNHYNNSYYSNNDNRTNPDFEYQMLDVPTNLKGMESLWLLITLNQNQDVIAKALEFLNNLHTNFDSNVSESEDMIKRRYYQSAYEFLQKQSEEGGDSERVKRCIMIMESILDESEKKGNGGLKSLMSLSKGELITLNFSTTFYNSDIPNNFTFKMYSNDSVMDLLYKVGLYIKCTYEEVALSIAEPRREIEAKENGKSIAELRLKNGEKLLVSQRKASPVKEEELIINGEINPKAITIFKKWFVQFQVDGKMKPLQVAQFINSCTNDNCQETDSRVVGCMDNYDKGKKGYLTEENFIEFYSTACRSKSDVVRKNLHTHGYRKDLKRYDEVTIESIDVTSMPRYILARDEKFFKMIFDLLDRKDVANVTWRLLSRLPISPVLYEKIVKLEGIRGQKNPNWETVLGGESMYKLLYNLHVIEYLMEEGETTNLEDKKSSELSSNKIISDESEELKQFKRNWRSDFIKLGGFDHLFKRFNSLLALKDILNMDSFQKIILSFILKIFKNYIVAAFACTQSHIYKTVTRMGFTHVPLPALILSIREDIRNNRALTIRRKESEYRENLIEQELKRMEMMDDQHTKSSNQNDKKITYEVKVEESEEFLQLLSSLQSQGLSNSILQKFDFKSFLNQLCKLCMDFITSNSELESEDRTIVEFSLLIASAILVYDKDISEQFFNQGQSVFTELLSSGLFYKGNQNIRKIFNHCFFMIALSHLSSNNSSPIQKLMSVLMNNIPGLHNDNQNCSQYFELFCGLLDSLAYHQIDTSVSYDWLDFSSLVKQLVNSLKNHESTETRTQTRNDKILIGILNLCDRILSFKEELKVEVGAQDGCDLVKELFHKCLFDLSDHHLIENEDIKKYDKLVVKCKGEQSRIAAFRLLLTLCKNCPQNMQILMENGLQKLIEMLPSNSGYQLSYMRESKSDYGYVGIKNLGCICYMIAMIQQFFMTPTFRYGLLMANDDEPENLAEAIYNKKKIVCDDNVLHQFQQMFSFLEMSDRMDYNPIEFCYSFKDYSGEPVNTVIQQDAQEFLNMIFDKLENGLKKTPFKNILEKVYGGKICSQVICSNCKQVNTRLEQFYNLSVEVKNFKSLTESLDKFIAGETIQGFKCEGCEKKVDVRKRICLSDLPNVLILHLQRIIFDLETLQNIKVNTRFEFPETLDLEPYTREGLEARESENGQPNLKDKLQYEYKLAGVVVHTGTAEYGHYYSYIESNRSFENLGQPMKESWLEYNDSRVRDFSIKNLENECFGGHNSDWDDSSFNFGWFRNRDNSKNAYILVYERKVKDPVELVFQNQEQMDKVMQTIPITKYTIAPNKPKENEQAPSEEIRLLVDYYDVQPYVPDNHFKKVWMDNHQFMFERHIYNESFYQFIKEITNSIDLPVLTEEDCPNGYYKDYDKYPTHMRESFYNLLQTHVKIIIDLLNKSLGSQMIDEMISRLRILLKLCPDHCAQFFITYFFKDFMSKEGAIIKSQDVSMKIFLSKMYADCSQIIISYHNLNLTSEQQQQEEEAEGEDDGNEDDKKKKPLSPSIIRGTMIFFLRNLIQYLPDYGIKNMFKNEQYFMFWEAFSQQGPEQMNFLIKENVCVLFLDYFMGDDSPLQQRKEYISSRSITPRYTHVIRCIANILEKAYTPDAGLSYKKQSKKEINIKSDPSSDKSKDEEIKLSPEVFLFVVNSQFWEKVVSNDTIDSTVLRQLIQKLSFNHQLITSLLSEAIVRGLYRLGLDEVKIFAQVIYHFLSLQDYYRQQRIEAILGIPILVQNYPVHQQHQHLDDSLQMTVHYGTYALNCIDDQSLCMKTSLQIESSHSMLEAIYVNRKNQDSISVSLLVILLQLAIENDDIAEYLALLPSPSYVFAKYVDFIDHFIKEYHHNSLMQKFSMFPRMEFAQNCLRLYPLFRQKIDAVYQRHNIKFISPENEQKQSNSKNQSPEKGMADEDEYKEKQSNSKKSNGNNQYNIVVQEIDKTEVNYSTSQQSASASSSSQDQQSVNTNNSNHLNQGIHPLYTIGKTRCLSVFREAHLPLTENFLTEESVEEFSKKLESVKNEEEMNRIIEEIEELKAESTHAYEYFNLYEREVNTFITENQPTQTGNKSYDPNIVRDNFIMISNMQSHSPWNGFFKNKYASYYSQNQHGYVDQQELNTIIERQFQNHNTIRELLVVNKTSYQIEIKLEFILHDPTNPNQEIFPSFGKYYRIKPKSNEVIYSVNKQNLQQEWGHYDINVQYTIFQNEDPLKCQLNLQILNFTQQTLLSSNVSTLKANKELTNQNHLVTCIGYTNTKQLAPLQYQSSSSDQLEDNNQVGDNDNDDDNNNNHNNRQDSDENENESNEEI